MGRLRRYSTAFGRYKRGKGFGIHSPFAFRFVLKVLRERNPYYAYAHLDALRSLVIARTRHHLRHPRIISIKNAKIIFRVTNYFNPGTVLQIGTSYGISSASIMSVSSKSRLYLCEARLAEYPVTTDVLADYRSRIEHFTDAAAGIDAYREALSTALTSTGITMNDAASSSAQATAISAERQASSHKGRGSDADWSKKPFVLINNLADDDEYAALSAYLSSLSGSEAVVIMRNLTRNELMRRLRSEFCEEAMSGMSFSNDKLAVFVINPKLPRQDFSIWF